MMTKFGVVHQPRLKRRAAARKTKCRQYHEGHRGQQREENADRAERNRQEPAVQK